MTKTSEAQLRASAAYRERQIDKGRKRLSGALIPEDVHETLAAVVAEGEASDLTGAIWHCVRRHAEREASRRSWKRALAAVRREARARAKARAHG